MQRILFQRCDWKEEREQLKGEGDGDERKMRKLYVVKFILMMH
jgi:hypothetical protein